MAGNNFRFKQFTIFQDKSAFKVGTDGVLLGAAANISGAGRILDIGTGTGLIALMLAQRCDAMITAIEPDNASFIQASENIRRSNWKGRIKVINCRLQDLVPGDGRFDLIVSNPPYFIDSLKNPEPSKSNARHNGNLTQSDILESMKDLLAEIGRLQVIMPYAEGNLFIASAAGYGLYCNDILKIKPLPTSPVKRLILSFSREKIKVTERFLVIEKGKRHDFTEDYVNLTKDFYLKF
jgi:tRNA1Val (adenine37-N6)-methyltransferase